MNAISEITPIGANELNAALAKARREFKPVLKNKVNPHFKNKYADLSELLDATVGALSEHGLSVTQTMRVDGAATFLVTELRHASGQRVESVVPLLALNKGAQPFGSELTYLRRYSYAALLNIAADDDDDANGAQASQPQKQAFRAAPPPATQGPPYPFKGKDGVRDLGSAPAWAAQWKRVMEACRANGDMDALRKGREMNKEQIGAVAQHDAKTVLEVNKMIETALSPELTAQLP